jgi:hypothetical protein
VVDFLSAGVILAAGCSTDVFVSGVAAGACLSFRVVGGFCFLSAGVEVAAGCSVEAGAFVSGADFLVGSTFFSDLSIFGGGASFVAGSFTAGVSAFGAVVAGFSARGFSFGACFLVVGACDSSGVGCWAITAPASASEATSSKLVIFFMVFSAWSVNGDDLFTTAVSCRQSFAERCRRVPRVERRSPYRSNSLVEAALVPPSAMLSR